LLKKVWLKVELKNIGLGQNKTFFFEWGEDKPVFPQQISIGEKTLLVTTIWKSDSTSSNYWCAIF
jgi:hypothetical protein